MMSDPQHTSPAADAPAWRLVIPSCDAYNDAWPFFFHFLFRYWPEVPTPVYLISNFTTFNDPRVQTIPVGEDRQWAANVRIGLERVPCDRVLVVLDDFFPNRPVDHARIVEFCAQATALDAKYLGLDQFAKSNPPVPGTCFSHVTPETNCVGLNVTFWQKSHLSEVCEPGLNIWAAERRLKSLAMQEPKAHFYLGPGAPTVITYVESIKGLFWKPPTIEFLKQHNLQPDFWRRTCPPQGDDPFSKLFRSLHKQRMRLTSRFHSLTGARFRPRVVEPLK